MIKSMKEHYLKEELYELFKTDSAFFNFLQENSLDGLWYWNLENIEDEWMSPRFWEVLGYDPKKKKHSSLEWQDIIFKEDLEKATINFEKHLQDPKYPYDQIVRYKHKDGSTVWIRCRGIAIRDESGKAIRMLGAHTNITEQQNQIIELNHIAKLTETLLETINNGVDYQKISDHVLSISNASFVAFNLYDEDGKHYITKAYSGDKGKIIKALNMIGMNFNDRKWEHDNLRAEKIKNQTVTHFPTLHDLVENVIPKTVCTILVKSFGLGESVIVKIEKDNVVIGDFTIMMSKGKVFDKSNIVEIYANQLGLVLINFWSNVKIKESEQRFRATLQSLDDGIIIHAPDSSIIDLNDRALQILGLSADQLLGKTTYDPMWKFVDENEKPLPFEKYPANSILASQKPINDLICGIVSSADKELVWVKVKGMPIFDYEGKMKEVVVSFFDITQLKNVNNYLIKSEKRYRLLFETMNQGVIYQDKDGSIISCNPKAEEILGLTLSQMQEKISSEPIWKLIDEDGMLIPGGQSPVMRALKNKELTGPMICGVFIPDTEEYKWLSITAIPLFIEGDEYPYQVYATFEDVTQLKIVEAERLAKQKEVEESENRFRLLTTEMPLGLAHHKIILDQKGEPIDYRFISVNDSFEHLTGLKGEDIIGKTVLEVLPDTEKYWIETYGKVALTGQSTFFENYAQALDKYFRVTVYSPKKGYFAVVVEDITVKREMELRQEYLITHDLLTNLTNRQYFNEQLALLNESKCFPITLINLDINGLIIINEAFGHKVGDEYIQFIAKTLKEVFDEDSVISRVGGDQFAVILKNTSTAVAESKAREVANIVKAYEINGVSLTISYGIATKHKDEDINQLFLVSESNMYSNKLFESQSYRNSSIKSMINAYHEKNPREEEHSYRVSDLCEKFGIALDMNSDDINKLKAISHLHDIGKIAIDEAILNKPGKLTEDEWEIIKKHPEIGARIISSSDEYAVIADDILSHHERWDGKGYPRGISGKNITLRARMIAIIDAYDAMISDRPYRKAMSQKEALEELNRCAGTQFDPELVEVFIKKVIISDLEEIII